MNRLYNDDYYIEHLFNIYAYVCKSIKLNVTYFNVVYKIVSYFDF